MSISHFSQAELAFRWRISPRTLERWRWSKTGPVYPKIGGRVIYRLEDMIVSVDNNDNYNVDYFNYSANSWFSLFSILSEYGNVTWGMDTFVIQTEIGFTPVNTDFIRIYGNGGDGMYAISEVWAWGSPISTPEPATMLLLGLGLLGLVGVRRKTQK